jgi:outer membrane protein OmpA-like peptidoglycan-associated protein
MQKRTIVFLMAATLVATSGCASKGFVRKNVQASADTLTARIETNEGEMKEIRDNADRKIAGVDSRVTALDSKTTEGLNTLKSDVQGVDQRATAGVTEVRGAAAEARGAADRAANGVNALDTRFQNRNNFNVSDEKTVQFKFDSAKLDDEYMQVLDGVASALQQNRDAIVVLEGRTDSTGNKDYNVKLGERRIDAVRRYLAVEKGVPVYKIHEISFGAEKPIAENKTKDGREKNRAVTITVMLPKADGVVASRND